MKVPQQENNDENLEQTILTKKETHYLMHNSLDIFKI